MKLHLSQVRHTLALGYQHLKRDLLRTDHKLALQYLEFSEAPGLHLGCSLHHLDGWLNTDIAPIPGAMRLDASKPFPLPSDSFDRVYSEHMIEHIPFSSSLQMLRECFRVLKPGGIIRIVTPDLSTILRLYHRENWLELDEAYFNWMSDTFCQDAPDKTPVFVINTFFREWGHQFIFDEPTLRNSMIEAGFSDLKRERLLESSHPKLRNLENVDRYPEGLLEHESIAVEAQKPVSRVE